MERSHQPASGGHVLPGMIYNAIGENVNVRDVVPNTTGAVRLSPWNTAVRGLAEEVGIQVPGNDVILHTLAWDRAILDYKFFGVVVTGLSRRAIRDAYEHAPDRQESRKLTFLDGVRRDDCRRLVQIIVSNQSAWADEASSAPLGGCCIWANSAPRPRVGSGQRDGADLGLASSCCR